MRAFASAVLAVCLLFGSVSTLPAAAPAAEAPPADSSSSALTFAPAPLTAPQQARVDLGREFSLLLAELTGVAISPVMGVTAVGMVDYFRTPEEKRDQLPWFSQPWFWILGTVIVLGAAFKDSAGAAVPTGWKKPLDILETVEEKISAAIAAGGFVPVVVYQFSDLFQKAMSAPAAASAESALVGTGPLLASAGLPLAALDWAPILTILALPFALFLFFIVWLVSHAITVLILLSPWGPVDAALKAARTGVMGLLALTAQIDPYLSAFLSVGIIVIAWFTAGWAFRLTTVGTVFSWDLLTFARTRTQVRPEGSLAFATRDLAPIPRRTLGRLSRTESGGLVFRYRPWLVLPPKTIELPAAPRFIGRGLLYPSLQEETGPNTRPRRLLFFPPRYRSHEAALAAGYAPLGDRPAGVLKGWAWLKDVFSSGADRPPQAAPST